MNRITSYVLRRYADAPYEDRGKTIVLFYFFLFLVPVLLMTIIGLNVSMQRSLFDVTNLVVACFIVLSCLCLALIVGGWRNTAATIFVGLVVLGLGINTWSNGLLATSSAARFTASTFPIAAAVVFAAYFCPRIVQVIASVVSMVLITTIFIIINKHTAYELPVVLVVLIITFIFISLISFFGGRISEQAALIKNEAHRRETDKQKSINTDLLDSLGRVSDHLDDASHRMSENSTEFLENMQKQAASIEEITATIEEISSSAERVTEAIQEQSTSVGSLVTMMSDLNTATTDMEKTIAGTREKTDDITGRARSGEEYLNQMMTSMNEIDRTSREMTGIIAIINDISDKINLLSLNAAIEAARAGEFGRGFAVVADEISKLADRTTASVKDIDRLIKKSEEEITAGTSRMGETTGSMADIIRGISEVNSLMRTISTSMERHMTAYGAIIEEAANINQRSEAIKISSDEQSQAASEIVRSISYINEIVQGNTHTAMNISQNLREIADMSGDLRDKAHRFEAGTTMVGEED